MPFDAPDRLGYTRGARFCDDYPLIIDYHRLPPPGDADPAVQQRIVESFVWAHSEWGLAGRMLNRRVRDEWGLDETADWQRVREELSQREGYEDLSNRTRTSTEQFGEAPGYYLIAALPQFLLSGASIEAQFMAARLVSVLLASDGITSGCGGDNYCPEQAVTRAQMAVFLTKAFDLPIPTF